MKTEPLKNRANRELIAYGVNVTDVHPSCVIAAVATVLEAVLALYDMSPRERREWRWSNP
jgi:hypothetical protein